MGSGKVIMVVGTDCPPGIEKEWNEWYAKKHIPEFMKMKGLKKAARYKIKPPEHKSAPNKGETAAEYPKYLAVYELESFEDLTAYYTGPGRAALVEDWNKWAEKGATIKWRVFYEPLETWEQ